MSDLRIIGREEFKKVGDIIAYEAVKSAHTDNPDYSESERYWNSLPTLSGVREICDERDVYKKALELSCTPSILNYTRRGGIQFRMNFWLDQAKQLLESLGKE